MTLGHDDGGQFAHFHIQQQIKIQYQDSRYDDNVWESAAIDVGRVLSWSRVGARRYLAYISSTPKPFFFSCIPACSLTITTS